MDARHHILQIIRNAFLYSVGAVVRQGLGFLLLPVYTRLITVTEYGTLGIAQTSQSLIGVTLALGLTSALSRIYYDSQGEEEKVRQTSSIFWFLLATAALFSLLAAVYARQVNALLFRGSQSMVLVYMLIFSILPMILTNTCTSFLHVKIQPRLFSASQIIYALVYHSCAIVLVKSGHGVSGIIFAGIVASAAALIFVLLHVKGDIPPGRFDFAVLGVLLKSGIPLMCIAMISWVLEMSDRFFIDRYVGTGEVGVYSLSNQIVLVLTFVNMVMVQAVPVYLFKVREADRELGERLQTEVLRYYSLITLPAALVLALFSREIIAVLAPPDYLAAHRFIAILAFSQIFTGGFYILHVGIANAKKFNYLLVCFAAAGAVNVSLNILLIPRYGGMGAAAATALSCFLLMVLGNHFSQKLYRMEWEYRIPASLAFLVVALILMGGISGTAGSVQSVFWKAAFLFVYALFSWKFGLTEGERAYIRQSMHPWRQR